MINQKLKELASYLDQVDVEYIISKNQEYIKFTDKNFLTLNIPSLVKYGVSITKNYDDSITLDGDCTVPGGSISPTITRDWSEDQLPPGDYKFVIQDDKGNIVNPYYFRIELIGLSTTSHSGTKLLDSYQTRNNTFRIGDDYKYHYFRLWIGEKHHFARETFYLMCVKSDVEDYSYEPSHMSLEWAIQSIIENKLVEIDETLQERLDEIEQSPALVHGIPISELETIWSEEIG